MPGMGQNRLRAYKIRAKSMCTIGPKFRPIVHHRFRHRQQQFEVPTGLGLVLLGAVSVLGVLQNRLKGVENRDDTRVTSKLITLSFTIAKESR